jgi:hypothetical protein
MDFQSPSTGGVSQTKQVSKNTPDLINIEALFSILSGIGKSMTPSKINPDELGKTVLDAVDKIIGISNAVKEAKEELSGDNSGEAENSQTNKTVGKPGDVTTRKVKTDSGTITITDSTTSEKNGGGEYIKVRLETKVEKKP